MEGQCKYGEHPLECESSNLYKDGTRYMHVTKNPAKAKKTPALHALLPFQSGTENMNAVMNLVIIGRHSDIVGIGIVQKQEQNGTKWPNSELINKITDIY